MESSRCLVSNGPDLACSAEISLSPFYENWPRTCYSRWFSQINPFLCQSVQFIARIRAKSCLFFLKKSDDFNYGFWYFGDISSILTPILARKLSF